MAATRSVHVSRHRFWRRCVFRRVGAWLAVLALLVQGAVFAAHHPSQAAAPLGSDLSVWCLASGHSPDGFGRTGDTGKKAPLDAAAICPICQTLQHAAKFLPVVDVTLAVPVSFLIFVEKPHEGAPLGPPAIVNLNPRAPPVFA